MWSQNVRRINDFLLPRSLWPAGLRRAEKEPSMRYRKCYYNYPPWLLLRIYNKFICVLLMDPSCWTVAIWLASLGWHSGPAGATLEGRPASSRAQPVPSGQTDLVHGSQRARWPIPPHYQGNQAPSVPLHRQRSRHPSTDRHSPTPPFTHRPPDGRPGCARSRVPTPSQLTP